MAKYEFMIYRLIAEQIETGHVHLPSSISFKSLASHLVSDEKWKNCNFMGAFTQDALDPIAMMPCVIMVFTHLKKTPRR